MKECMISFFSDLIVKLFIQLFLTQPAPLTHAQIRLARSGGHAPGGALVRSSQQSFLENPLLTSLSFSRMPHFMETVIYFFSLFQKNPSSFASKIPATLSSYFIVKVPNVLAYHYKLDKFKTKQHQAKSTAIDYPCEHASEEAQFVTYIIYK